jgi:hypothetical protein
MKIRDASSERTNAVGGVSSLPPAAKAGPSLGSPTVTAATDQVQLSSLAQMAAGNGDSPTHVAKLSSLSATISIGGYQVAAGVLSNNIIEASMRLTDGNYA